MTVPLQRRRARVTTINIGKQAIEMQGRPFVVAPAALNLCNLCPPDWSFGQARLN